MIGDIPEEPVKIAQERYCGAGKSLCFFDMEGDVYPCHMLSPLVMPKEKALKGMYFAEERLMGTLTCSGLPVYYQTRCTPLCNLEYDYASAEYERKSEKAHLTCKELDAYCFNPLWIADFVEQYGKEEFRRLSLFLDEMSIGDLRDCNIGYLDGAPILFDYSGFRHWN